MSLKKFEEKKEGSTNMFVQQMSVYVTKVSYVAGVHYTRAWCYGKSTKVEKYHMVLFHIGTFLYVKVPMYIVYKYVYLMTAVSLVTTA